LARRICAADISARCAAAQGKEGIHACVKEHLNDLSESCRAGLARLAAIKRDCAADIKRHCAEVRPGRGRVEACLKPALGNLSDACKDALAAAPAAAR